MSYLPLSLMTENKTESAVFKLYMLYFQRIPFTDNLETTTVKQLSLCPFGGPTTSPRTSISVVI